jgi:hypothetical protein
MGNFDERIVKVSIEVNGVLKVYQDLELRATGTKYSNENQNECEVKITNVDNDTLNYILTETSPFNKNKTPKSIIVEAGRVSYGVTKIFEGNIISATPSQPPDIYLTIKALTKNFSKGDIVSNNQPASVKLSKISKSVSDSLGTTLDFQASDKNISNYAYSGAALKQVEKLNSSGEVSAYIDDNVLVVKDLNLPIANRITIVNEETGMIGIPEVTEHGIKVTFLLDGQTKLGGLIRVKSKIYEAVNGDYVIYKLGFDIANRDTPFYWIAEGKIYGEQ